jgi:hypothetical protein
VLSVLHFLFSQSSESKLKQERVSRALQTMFDAHSNKLPRFITFLLGGAALCLTVQADQTPSLPINPPENGRRELLASSSVSFVYTGAAQKW